MQVMPLRRVVMGRVPVAVPGVASAAHVGKATSHGPHAQPDQHQCDQELEGTHRRRREFRAQRAEYHTGREQRRRMSEPPPCSEPCRAAAAVTLGDKGRQRRHVIGLASVAHAGHETAHARDDDGVSGQGGLVLGVSGLKSQVSGHPRVKG